MRTGHGRFSITRSPAEKTRPPIKPNSEAAARPKMFSIQHPSILAHLGQLTYGLQPVLLMTDGVFSLLMKATKEAILTARLNQQIKVYLVPDGSKAGFSLGFITAFFDDHDEPLVLFTPLYVGDDLLTDLTAVLSQETFDLYFFDEHDREMMGVHARLRDAERFRSTLAKAHFKEFDPKELGVTLGAMGDWFGERGAGDDDRAFIVGFESTLYPDDLMVIDARPAAYDFQGAEGHLAATSLERDEPGAYQERDLVRLLRRSFPGEAIFLNPIRTDTGTELADIVCLADEVLLLVQAKDSPNTEASLRRSLDRKRAVIRAHIDKGARQMRGALSYVKGRNELSFSTSSGTHALNIKGRLICGVVVVREMFDDDYTACSAPVLAVANDCRVPCVLLDYAAAHTMTLYLGSPPRLLNGLCQLFETALEHGEYPKPRFLGQPNTSR